MKKIFLILLTFISLNIFAQSDSFIVKEGSFHKVDGCVTIPAHTDINDLPMGVIKIIPDNINEQQRMRLTFEGNLATDIEVEQHEGETWVYVTARAVTFLRIKHPDFGVTEFYPPMEIEANQCYEMTLQYLPLTPTSAPEPKQQKKYHLIVKADQADATIYIDDEPLDIGEASKLVDEGTIHTYKIECKLYHAETGTVTVNERTVIEKKLRPNFGYINVTTSPESGAKVYIDGEYLGLSPIKTDKLKSGSHTVRVMKDMFKMKEQAFVVNDGQTTNATLNMSANFVNVTINTDADADIYVDEEYKGKGRWTGRVSDGLHNFEARKANHRTTKKSLDLVLGENVTVTLDNPQAINGSLDVNSSPMSAEIYIDGKHYGQTPNYINEILIGTHELKLEKSGCATLTKTITIKENETLTINEKLQTAKEITISTDQSGDKIYVDGNYIGTSPITSNLSYGSHNIKAVRNDKEVSKTISVSQSGGDDNVKLSFGEINGHEYVDLGLSVKWATCNVGASKPEDYGNYYAWGETKTKSDYSSTNSVTYRKSISDIGGKSQYDAARANWGGTWRLPTKAELEELEDKCTRKWTTQNGVNGYKVTGPNGNSIFLPAAGYSYGWTLYNAGGHDYYWSSTPDESDYAYFLHFSSTFLYVDSRCRYHGLSVRPVAE